MSASSSPDTAAPPVTATGVTGVAGSNTLVPRGSQPAKSRRAEGMNPSCWGGATGAPCVVMPVANCVSDVGPPLFPANCVSDAGPPLFPASCVSTACVSKACATATLASLIAAIASPIDAALPSEVSAVAATAGAGGTTPGGVSRSPSQAQRNSPAGGSIRTHNPAWRPAAIRTSSITCTRSPASRLTWATCRRSLSCDPTRDTAPSVTITPTPRPGAWPVGGSPMTETASTSQARSQLKLPTTGRRAT